MPEKISVRLNVPKDTDIEPLEAEFTGETLPRSPADIARIIKVRESEITRIPEDDLTDEHLFVLELQQALRDFQSERDVPFDERITLDQLAVIVESGKSPKYSPERLRELYSFLVERYPLGSADVSIEGVDSRSARTLQRRASADILSAMGGFWQKIYRATLRHEYESKFPERIRNEISDIVWEEDSNLRQELVEQLVRRVSNFPPERNRILIRMMYEEVFGHIAGTVFSRPELRKLSEYVATYGVRDVEEPLTPEQLLKNTTRVETVFLNLMRKGGRHPQRKTLRGIITGLERSAMQPEQFLTAMLESQDLISHEHIFSTLVAYPPLQKNLFIASLEERFSEGIAGTIKAFSDLQRIVKEMSSERRILRSSPEDLARWCERLADELNEIRTSPGEREEARIAPEEETSESVLTALRMKNARVERLAHAVTRLSEQERMAIFEEVAKWVVVRERIKNLPARLGRGPGRREVDALIGLIEKKGAGTNEAAWEILLTVANRYRRFREGM